MFRNRKIDQKCPECNGVDFENCAKCLGKGTVEEECPDCKDESKQIDCPDCNGNKTVECKTCYGTKEIEARDFEFKFDGDVSVSFKGSVKILYMYRMKQIQTRLPTHPTMLTMLILLLTKMAL